MKPQLIGRSRELEALERFVDGLPAGPAGFFVEGEAGIGKTRLWQEALANAGHGGHTVVTTRPGAAEAQLAFSGLADLLAGRVDSVLSQLPPPQGRALAIALLIEESRGAVPDERAVAAAFAGALRVLATDAPLLVAVDDLQWLDVASARVLAFAMRRLDSEPVGVLATIRVDPAEREPVELARAIGTDRLTRIALPPMSIAAIFELVRMRLGLTLSRRLLRRIHELSGGRPFFALEIARALADAGHEPAPDEPLPVPSGLRDVVRARLALLSESTRETLLLAAALSRPTCSVVERAAGKPREAAADLERAQAAAVIDVEGDRIRFTHPLLASVHYSAAPTGRRRDAHRRLAGAVSDPEERARHLALAADGPDEEAAAALERAATRANRRGAVAAAAELAEQALSRTPEADNESRRRRLLVAAELEYSAGDTERALVLLDEELRDSPAGSRRAELLWTRGRISFEGRNTHVGMDYFRRALRDVGGNDPLKARILESLAFAGSAGEETFQAAQRYAAEAAKIAERADDRPTLALALAHLADLRFICGEPLQTELFERAVALEELLGGLELEYGPTTAYARALVQAGEYDRARPLLERQCKRGRESGDAAVHMPLFVLACLEFETGHWDRADRLAREAYDVAVQSGREAAEPKGLFTLARVQAARGEVEKARANAEAALVLTDSRGWKSGGPRSALGFLELSLERYEAAYDALLPAIERYRGLGVSMIGQDFDAVEALAALGRIQEGWAMLAPAETVAREAGLSWAIAASARARALLAAAAHDLAAAEAALVAAVAEGEQVNGPLELGRSLLALGSVRRRAGRKRAARDALERALAIFQELGARLWAERAVRELGRIGGRSTPRRTLSETEAEIVELVCTGRSNREVAQALHLSPKTVEWNLSKIYRKLGVRSRTELAAANSRR